MKVIAEYHPTKRLIIEFQQPHNKAGQLIIRRQGVPGASKHPVDSLAEAESLCNDYHTITGVRPILLTVEPTVDSRLLDGKGNVNRAKSDRVKAGGRHVSIG